MNTPLPTGWRTLDAVLDELERAAATATDERSFCELVCRRLREVGCAAVAVSLVGGETVGDVAAFSPEELTGEPRELLTGASVPWKTGAGPGAPGHGGSLAVRWPANATPPTQPGWLHFLTAVADVIGACCARGEQTRLRTEAELQRRLQPFLESLHERLELSEVVYRLANDGRSLLACDRLAVAVRVGACFRLRAVSGAEHIHRHSESARELERLCRCVERELPFWHEPSSSGTAQAVRSQPDEPPTLNRASHAAPCPTDRSPQVDAALARYLDISPAIALVIWPLAEGDLPPVAVLICEQYSAPFSPRTRAVLPQIARHAAIAISNGQQLAAIPAHRWWLAAARHGWTRWLTKTTAWLSLAAVIVATLALVPAEVEIKARGELQPVVRQDLFAPRDGLVTEVRVDHGERVERDDPLVAMRSSDLDLELQRVGGELETTRKQLAATQSEQRQARPTDADQRQRVRRLTADEEQFKEQIRGLESRQQTLLRQQTALTLRSPIAGEVLTWNAKQRLDARPVRRGDDLLSIADTSGPWQVELRVPSRSVGRFLAARRGGLGKKVSFVLTAAPGKSLDGLVQDVAPQLETAPEGDSYLRVTVATDREALPLRVPASTVVARVACGRGVLATAWFYELWDAIRLAWR